MKKRALDPRPVTLNITIDFFGSLAIIAILLDSDRPIALRHQFSLVLPLSDLCMYLNILLA
jgi:hypothetical protein